MTPRHRWSRLLGRVAARVWVVYARLLYRRGLLFEAARWSCRALALQPTLFEAHLLLGKVYLRLDRLQLARHEFAQARFLDPVRYRREALPESWFLDLAASGRPSSGGRARAASSPAAACAKPPSAPPRDDCSSRRERARFARLGPITREEIAAVDWEELLRRLADDASDRTPPW